MICSESNGSLLFFFFFMIEQNGRNGRLLVGNLVVALELPSMVRWPLVRVGVGLVRKRGKERKRKKWRRIREMGEIQKGEQVAGRENGEEEEKEGKGAVVGEEIEGFRVLFFKRMVEIKYENGGCIWVL